MTTTIQIDNELFDPEIENFSFSFGHHIEDMSELAKLRLLPHLMRANFAGTNLDDRGLQYVTGASTIDHLDLQDTKISNDGLAHLASLSRLKYLRLKENRQLTNDCIAHLLRLNALVEIQVHETSIDQLGLNRLVGLPELRHICLDVWHDNYSFQGLLELSTRMPRCSILAKGRGEFRDGTFEGTWERRA